MANKLKCPVCGSLFRLGWDEDKEQPIIIDVKKRKKSVPETPDVSEAKPEKKSRTSKIRDFIIGEPNLPFVDNNDNEEDDSATEDPEEKGGEGDMEEIKSEDGDLIEDTSDLGEDDDDIGEVMEHLDEDVEDKT